MSHASVSQTFFEVGTNFLSQNRSVDHLNLVELKEKISILGRVDIPGI